MGWRREGPRRAEAPASAAIALTMVLALAAGCGGEDRGGELGAGEQGGAGGGEAIGGGGDDAAPGFSLPDWPQPQQHQPCDAGTCWDTSAALAKCGYVAVYEDFSSGNYNVHRYASRIWAGSVTELALRRTAGDLEPALLIGEVGGGIIFDGEVGAVKSGMAVIPIDSGQEGDSARVRIHSAYTADIDVYVTGWQVVESGFVDFLPTDVEYRLELESLCEEQGPGDALAPDGTLEGETDAGPGAVELGDLGADWTPPLRFDVPAGTHVELRLDPSPAAADDELQVLMFDGAEAVEMATVDQAMGGVWNERVLSVLDTGADRTYWARLRGSTSQAQLLVTYTPFVDAPQCHEDCDLLLQLPLPNFPTLDGYFTPSHGDYPEQYGRRDLLMFLRHAGETVAAAGSKPMTIKDLSMWDGDQPPGHASHTLGKDVDISLYDAAGNPVWTPRCQVDASSECVPGTVDGYDARAQARLLSAVVLSGRVTYAFLDQELIPATVAAAEQLVDEDEIDAALVPELDDVLSHWPNHHDHVHVRVSTEP